VTGSSRSSVAPAPWPPGADHLPDVLLTVGADGTITWANRAVEGVLGHRVEDLLGVDAMSLVHPDDVGGATDGLHNVVEHPGRLAPSEYRVRHADGSWLDMEVNAGVDASVEPPQVVIVARDISHRQALDAVLASLAAGARLETTLTRLAHAMDRQLWEIDVVIAFDGDDGERCAVGVDLPPALSGVVDPVDGASPWLEAERLGEVVVDDDLARCGAQLRALAAERGYTSCAVTPVADFGGRRPACMIIWSRDARLLSVAYRWSVQSPSELAELALERRHHLVSLERAASHDALTGLPNRTVFFSALDLGTGATKGPRALLYLDLDSFKAVNDTHGHVLGDRFLALLADRLRTHLRPGDLVARIGGDEFAVLCPSADAADAITIAERLLTAVGGPIEIDGLRLHPGLSIGIAIDRTGACAPDAVLEAADLALYDAKRQGKGRWVLSEAGSTPPG
jgi:diguanylate cyclase (GGDEF)-like protein/PAS domain S-box-containing protein